ncbi:MAG TPA: ABC transporter permease [Candidatus Acidoferrum sp.]|nr:ABC transporter permease [Candidatus Acidoferrum sp.]
MREHWWRRASREQELERELRAHLELEAEEHRDAGMTPPAARYASQRVFGNTARVMEETREAWGFQAFEQLLQDVRYGLRTMRRSPGFTAIAVLSLTLGIGANTAIFSLINVLMLRPLAVKEPDRLVEILTHRGKGHGNAFSWQTYRYLRDGSSLWELAASHRNSLYTRVEGLGTEKIEGQYCTGNYFPMLGIQPALGRLIGPEDDRMGSPATVAVVSWAYWKNRLGMDPGVIGRKVEVEDVPFTIVGVAPRDFVGLQVGLSEDIFIPLATEPLTRRPTYTANAGYKWLQLISRAKPGVSLEQIHAAMNVLFRRTLEIEAQDRHESSIPDWTIDVAPAGSGFSLLRDQFSKPLLVLMAIVCVLLLIACANVAGMLLAKGAARQREMALRVSLGAGRLRLVRQMVTESLILSGAAAILGVALAYAGGEFLVRILASGRLPIELQVTPDARVLLFTAGLALCTGIVFGLIPAFRAAPAFRDSSRGGETRARRFLGKALIASQVAFSVVLLTAAGMFLRNLSSLKNRDIGVRREGVVMVALDPSHSGYEQGQLASEYQRLLGRIELIPGVHSASLCWMPPIAGGGMDGNAFLDGSTAPMYVYKNLVGPRYFETVGTSLLAGREFDLRDQAGSTPVAIVNRTLARAAFGDGNPLGHRIKYKVDDSTWYEIVGVVSDAKYVYIREKTQPTVYVATMQQSRPASQFVIRTAMPLVEVMPPVRQAIRGMQRSVLIGKITTLETFIDSSIVEERLIATLSSLFGALGSLLAAVGLYGLLAYTVARRTNEIGIRMALGANRGSVIRMVLSEAILMVLAGLAAGVPLAIAGERAAGSMIPNLPAGLWMPVAMGVAAMIATGIVAAYLPARRASRVDPMVALRYE